MGLFEELGLGFVINYNVKGARDVEQTTNALERMAKESNLTKKQVEKDAEAMARAYQQFRQEAMQGLKLIGAGAAVLATLGIPAIAAGGSEDRMNAVRSLLSGTGISAEEAEEQIRSMHAAILDMAGDVRVPLAQIEDAAYNLVSANLSAAEAQAALLPTAQMAVAGLGQMNEGVELMAAILNTYGKAWGDTIDPVTKADRIANTISGTIAGLNTKLPLLSEAFKFVAGDANVLKISLEETAVTLGMLQTQGLQGGRAGTSLMAFLRELLAMERKSDSLLGPLKGLQLEGPGGGLRALPDILRDIQARTAGMSEVQLGTLFGSAFGEEGSRAVKLLVNQADALEQMIGRVSQGNVLLDMVADRQRGANAQWEIAKNQLQAYAIQLGDQLLPLLTPLIQSLGQMVEGLRLFVAEHPMLTRMMLLFVGTAGVMLMLAGTVKIAMAAWTLYTSVMKLMSVQLTISTASFGAFAASVWAALWPILAVMAALAGVIKLIDIIADTDMFGSIIDFITGRDLIGNVAAPQLQFAGAPLQVPASPQIVHREQAGGGGGGQYIDQRYQTVKLNTSVSTQGTEPRQIAEQVADHNERMVKASPEGKF